MQVNNQPSFGSAKILRETFKHLPSEIRPAIEAEINRCEPALKKMSRGINLKIDVKPESSSQLDVFIQKKRLFSTPDVMSLQIPVEKVSEAKLDFFLHNVIKMFHSTSKQLKKSNSAQKNLSIFLRGLEKPMEKLK